MSDYALDPETFLKTHNNREIFIALFSEKSKVNGKKLYEQFMDSLNKNDIQTKIDKMNKFDNQNDKWSFNSLKKEFDLPNNSNKITIKY